MAWSVTRAESSEQLVFSTGCLSPIRIPQGGGAQKRHRQQQVMISAEDGLDFDDLFDELSLPSEKKKRLTLDQIQFLEMSFSSNIKLEPERKAEIAKKLGLRPRQVAIWFQNRRVRWKNKQVEQEYEELKVKYEELTKENCSIMKKSEAILLENNQLQAEVAHLRSLLQMSTKHCSRAIISADHHHLVHGISQQHQLLLPGFDSDSESGSKELTSMKSSEDPADVKDSGHSAAAATQRVEAMAADQEDSPEEEEDEEDLEIEEEEVLEKTKRKKSKLDSNSFMMCTAIKLDYEHHHHATSSFLLDVMEDQLAQPNFNMDNHFSFFLDEQAFGLVWS